MFETFDTTPGYEQNITKISFSDNHGKYIMKLVTINKKEALALKGRIVGLRGIYEMDSPTYQNFNIECNEEKGIVTLLGNISNAFNILKENKLISANLILEILNNGNVTSFIHETNTFILPENRENLTEAAKPNISENLSSLNEKSGSTSYQGQMHGTHTKKESLSSHEMPSTDKSTDQSILSAPECYSRVYNSSLGKHKNWDALVNDTPEVEVLKSNPAKEKRSEQKLKTEASQLTEPMDIQQNQATSFSKRK